MGQLYDFFALRRPLYSLTRLNQFYDHLAATSLPDALRQFFQDRLAQEALLIASPTVYARLQQWLAGTPIPEEKKLLATFHKYVVRMGSRPTPYGLFAGLATGTFADRTYLPAGSPAHLRAHARLDIDCLQAIAQWLNAQPALRPHLRLFPNTSIYPVGTSLRYVEQQPAAHTRNYFISAVEADTYLTTLLDAARPGATLTDLAAQLPNVPTEEAEAFVEQLIDSQLLVFETEPAITGLNALARLTDKIAALPGGEPYANALRELGTYLQQPDRPAAYAALNQWLADRHIAPPADTVQVDTYIDVPSLTLGQPAMRHLQHDLEKLLVLNQPAPQTDLDAFKHRFVNRYEEEEVPLALALDSEYGLGYGSASTQGVGYAPLIDDLSFNLAAPITATGWEWWQRFLMDKYADALRTRQTEIALTDDDLTYIRQQRAVGDVPTTPYSYYAFGSLLAASERAVDEGNFLFNLMACGGPSAMNLLGRFGEGHPELAAHIRACAAEEEAHQPNVVIAEVVHLPENRVGNILTRPTIHQYEIPYLGQSSVDAEHQILLTDLMVSVRNNRVILRSKRLNQRVIPRLTTAHNFARGLPIYRFLCDLQTQKTHLNVAWNWSVLSNQTYLPRVRYRRVIVSRATWQLDCRTLTPDNPLKLVTQLTAAGLPEQFVLAQGDNELLIRMHVPESLDLLAQAIRKTEKIKLIEFLHQPGQTPLTHQREAHAHELILPFRSTAQPEWPGLRQLPAQSIQRRFSVGSEWFYLKVYTGEKTSDALLVQSVLPVVQHLLKRQIITAFFFIRYQDPDPHLRLRFRGNPHVEFYQYVVRAMEQALQEELASGVVHRLQVDTYQRELERYGMARIEHCETLFHLDSLSTLTLLAQTDGLFDEDLRFAVAVAKIDRLFVGLDASLSEQRQLMNRLKEEFFAEFGGQSALRQQLNDKYRTYQALVRQATAPDFAPHPDLWHAQADQIATLRRLADSFDDRAPLLTLAGSVIHMIVNRLFPTKQRTYELVLYHCLAKHYDSVGARAAKQDLVR